MMEEITERLLKDHANSLNLPCQCERCLLDVLAIALNNLPPQYIVQDCNEAYVKAKFLENQYRINVISELASAAVLVSKSPRH